MTSEGRRGVAAADYALVRAYPGTHVPSAVRAPYPSRAAVSQNRRASGNGRDAYAAPFEPAGYGDGSGEREPGRYPVVIVDDNGWYLGSATEVADAYAWALDHVTGAGEAATVLDLSEIGLGVVGVMRVEPSGVSTGARVDLSSSGGFSWSPGWVGAVDAVVPAVGR